MGWGEGEGVGEGEGEGEGHLRRFVSCTTYGTRISKGEGEAEIKPPCKTEVQNPPKLIWTPFSAMTELKVQQYTVGKRGAGAF